MFKRILVLVMLAMSICSIGFTSEQDVVNSFNVFIKGVVNEIRSSHERGDVDVRFIPTTQLYVADYWCKVSQDSFQYDIVDIRKTESLMTPYMAVVDMQGQSYH